MLGPIRKCSEGEEMETMLGPIRKCVSRAFTGRGHEAQRERCAEELKATRKLVTELLSLLFIFYIR